MSNAANFTAKLTLAQANVIRRALERHRDASLAEAGEHDSSTVAGRELAEQARRESMDAKRILDGVF
jgi:hypothetical protein